MHRRHFLKTASLSLAGVGLASELFAQENKPKDYFISNGGEPALDHLTCYPDTQNGKHQLFQLWVRKNNTVLTSYRAHQTQKYPFFYPVAGPVSGLSLTAETAMPWPHHRSLFFGLDKVNGGNYWQEGLERGQIVSQGPSFAKGADGKFLIDDKSAQIVDRCLWSRKAAFKDEKDFSDAPIIEDNRVFKLQLLDDRRYVIDADITVKALVPITVPKTNHGLFGVRTAPDISPVGGGKLVNADGAEGQPKTEGKPSRWLAFYGKRAGLKEDVVEGIAVFCPSKAPHPKFENCPWFTRDYGNCSPMPFNFFKGDEKLELAEGEELKLRYRVVAFAGTPQDADLDGLWTEFDNG